MIWRDRGDAAKLVLAEGATLTHHPGKNFKFIEEIKTGTSPKFEVEDENGVKWKVKVGPEVKPETASTRLVWAAGYFVDEDTYRPEIRVAGMKRLSRGREYVSGDGVVRGVRLERHFPGKEAGTWSWYHNPFLRTREFNGLRIMMSLINNWDLKETNNDIHEQEDGEQRYVVSDLGASFGRTGNPFTRSKGVMKDYVGTKFIDRVTAEQVNFVMHSRPFFLAVVDLHNYLFRTRMQQVTKHIPIQDARWLGNRLGQFSPQQVSDCFRSSGFSAAEVEGYTRVVMQRIDALKKL